MFQSRKYASALFLCKPVDAFLTWWWTQVHGIPKNSFNRRSIIDIRNPQVNHEPCPGGLPSSHRASTTSPCLLDLSHRSTELVSTRRWSHKSAPPAILRQLLGRRGHVGMREVELWRRCGAGELPSGGGWFQWKTTDFGDGRDFWCLNPQNGRMKNQENRDLEGGTQLLSYGYSWVSNEDTLLVNMMEMETGPFVEEG